MTFTHELEKQVLVLQFSGDLIGENNGPQLMDLVNDHINEGVKRCAVDISQLRYINSSGLGVLITLLTKFRNVEGEVVLINPSEQVKKLLIITKLNAIFQIVNTKEEAISKLEKV
ncbi:STAS domain-containing protein [Xanthovirga aplysinae]|uniref:STAS domain-containing protein n=1 Tax=Xanthovirga aplysinae TaxID=2529853 RepID=UPI0012BB7FC0|nr:STAS domain-containing protein [Xanthovirga aplysinae]MTI31789.1 anti-sigma factor antagonist [Xanthovirga aplysinae]